MFALLKSFSKKITFIYKVSDHYFTKPFTFTTQIIINEILSRKNSKVQEIREQNER